MLLAIALSAAGCATSRAQIPEPQPTLVVPPVPPRAIEPPVVVEPPAVEPPVEAPVPAPTTTKPNRPRPAADASKPDPKQEPPPDTVAAVPPPPPVAPLRTATTPTGPEATRQIRDILENTQKMLDKVDTTNLSDDRKANLTSARALMQQAEEALKKEELTQARSFADRALNIAKVLLSGR
jgi:type IV secretory pathway VirB10-like protein